MLPNNTICKLRKMIPMMLAACCALIVCMLVVSSTTLAATVTKDQCGYPDSSHLKRSLVVFNESAVLAKFSPATGGATRIGSGLQIRMWYNDEHALTLGVRQVVVRNSAGTII